MILRKESFFAWLGLIAVGAVIVSVVGNKINLRAGTEDQVAPPISVVPIQLGHDSYGVAMVDAKAESIWIYEINPHAAVHSRLKLLAARSWRYDKMLEEYNSAEPRPQQVKNIIEQLLKPGGSRQVSEANSADITTLAEPNKPK